jgi:hypothetical protein
MTEKQGGYAGVLGISDKQPSKEQNHTKKIKEHMKGAHPSMFDETGKPKTFYHSTISDFENYRIPTTGLKLMDGLGIHFGTLKAAQDRLDKSYGKNSEGGNIRPVHLAISKFPAKRDGSIMNESELQSWLSKEAIKIGVEKHKTRAYSQHYPLRGEVFNKLRNHLSESGYNGLAYKNSHEDKGSTSYAAFDPDSAIPAI